MFLHDTDGCGSFDVFDEALAVLESDLDVGEWVLGVLAVPFFVIPGADEFVRLVVSAWGERLEEEGMFIPTMSCDDPDGASFFEGDSHGAEGCGEIGVGGFSVLEVDHGHGGDLLGGEG